MTLKRKMIVVTLLLGHLNLIGVNAFGGTQKDFDVEKAFNFNEIKPEQETSKESDRLQKVEVRITGPIDLKTQRDLVFAKLVNSENPKLRQVTLIGRGGSFQTKHGKITQVIWYGLKAKKKGVEKAVGLNGHLKSTYYGKGDVIQDNEILTVSGDVQGMLKLAENLMREEDVSVDKESKSQEKENQKDTKAFGNTKGSKGSGQLSNQFNPATVKVPEKKEKSKKSSYTSTDGCEPNVDLEHNLMQMTARKVETKDGQVSNKGVCQPTGETKPIQKDYKGCTPKIDFQRSLAFQQYRQYWITPQGQPQYLGGCVVDEEKQIPLEKDYSLCSPEVDIEGNVVKKKYTLKFKDEAGVDVVVKACTADPDQVINIEQTDNGCGMRHDFKEHISHIQKKKYYVNEGNHVVVSPCTDSGETIKHELDFKGCPPIRNEAGKPIPQARRMITKDGIKQVISECSPVENIEQHVHKTRQGCEKEFIHNIPGGETQPTARFYVSWDDRQEFITGCVIDDEAPARELGYDILDYEHRDDTRESIPNVQHYVDVDGQKILAGDHMPLEAAKVPYEFLRSEAKRTKKYHVGCVAHYERDKVSIYKRPDESSFEYVTERLEPEVGQDECKRKMEPRAGFYVGCSLSPEKRMASSSGGAYGSTPGISAANVQNHNELIDRAIRTGCSGDGRLYRQVQNPSKDQLIINVNRQREVHTLPDGTIAYLGGWEHLGFYQGSYPPNRVSWE